MKRVAILFLFVAALVAAVPASRAQSVEFGAFAEYMHFSQTDNNFAGVGARLGVGVAPHLKLEGEMAYDFNQVFTEGFTDTGTGQITVGRTSLRLLHGLFGPTFELGHSNFHPFVTVKGGFINTRLDSRPATVGTFLSSVDNLRSQDISAVLYPGGGIEGRIGPIGLRLDVGDEMYFNSGTHHNLRVAFGPYFHF